MPSTDPPPLRINRAPVLTLWAAVVAERLGHPEETALTLGRAVAGASARTKARRLGIAEERSDVRGDEHRTAARGQDRKTTPARAVRLLGREIPVAAAKGGTMVALDGEKPASPAFVRNYLARAFGERLGEVRAAMEKLAVSLQADELERVGFRLYEQFRPEVPEEVEGWGAKAELRIERIENAGH